MMPRPTSTALASLLSLFCLAACSGAGSDDDGSASSDAVTDDPRGALTAQGFHFVRTDYAFVTSTLTKQADRFEDDRGRIAYVSDVGDPNDRERIFGPLMTGKYQAFGWQTICSATNDLECNRSLKLTVKVLDVTFKNDASFSVATDHQVAAYLWSDEHHALEPRDTAYASGFDWSHGGASFRLADNEITMGPDGAVSAIHWELGPKNGSHDPLIVDFEKPIRSDSECHRPFECMVIQKDGGRYSNATFDDQDACLSACRAPKRAAYAMRCESRPVACAGP